MDLFKFNSPTGAPFRSGVALDKKPTSTMWIERYREPGEFKLEGPLSSGLREFLPIGTFISHFDTKEIMIVEDHTITDSEEDTTVSITGRSLEVVLEDRIVGAGLGWNDPITFTEYTLAANNIGAQALMLMQQHMALGWVSDPNDEIPYISVSNAVPIEGQVVQRVMKREDVHKALVGLLEINNYGIKNNRNPDGTATFVIHAGIDRSARVIFSWKYRDLTSAEYLFSRRTDKNVAYVKGRYVEEFVYAVGATKANRRVLLVDGSDLDDYFDAVPTGSNLSAVRAKMYTRGEQALMWNNPIDIARVDLAPITQFHFREDYEVGDLVAIDANYGAVDVRRVTEYTEIEDENGESGHPTFDVI
jgi:hypothetical protein